jgi:hypothetical protein
MYVHPSAPPSSLARAQSLTPPTSRRARIQAVCRHPCPTQTPPGQAHAAKEEALSETQALKLQAEREHAQLEEEFGQLTQIIEDDRRCAGTDEGT